MIGAKDEHPYAARGDSLAVEGNKLSCPWAHGDVRHDVARNGVVAETYAHVTLRYELESRELLVWAKLIDGGGVGLQVI